MYSFNIDVTKGKNKDSLKNCKLFHLSSHSHMEHQLCVRYHISLRNIEGKGQRKGTHP